MTWDSFIAQETQKDYFIQLLNQLEKERAQYTIYPRQDNTYRAFNETPFDEVKVIILGQDPYHGGQANGLAFAVNKGVSIPPSLRNICKEIEDDIGEPSETSRMLTSWAAQGVFLLNSTLTVREGQANSHSKLWWHVFTDNAIKALNEDNRPKVFILWGNFAKKKRELITNPNHLILEAAHPSPLSANRGFFGCKHFSKTNEFLKSTGQKEIVW